MNLVDAIKLGFFMIGFVACFCITWRLMDKKENKMDKKKSMWWIIILFILAAGSLIMFFISLIILLAKVTEVVINYSHNYTWTSAVTVTVSMAVLFAIAGSILYKESKKEEDPTIEFPEEDNMENSNIKISVSVDPKTVSKKVTDLSLLFKDTISNYETSLYKKGEFISIDEIITALTLVKEERKLLGEIKKG